MPRPTTHHRCHQIALGAALSVLLAGCSLPGWLSFPEQVRGNKIDPDQLSQLVPWHLYPAGCDGLARLADGARDVR